MKNIAITETANAKINIFLHVVGRRNDGYHLLDSLVVFADYGDEIQVVADSKLRLDVIGKFAEELLEIPKENNLVWKAAEKLQKFLPKPLGARIVLKKNLPLSSGIGGGSADAAAAIIALKKLWKIDISDDELSEIALSLGSDVPVCLYKKISLMRGIGEIIIPFPIKGNRAYIVLINPRIPLSTPEVFKNFANAKPKYKKELLEIPEDIFLLADKNSYANDLQLFAIEICPVIGDILKKLEDSRGCVFSRMSGSGATCFAVYKNKEDAINATEELQKIYKQAWCVNGEIINNGKT